MPIVVLKWATGSVQNLPGAMEDEWPFGERPCRSPEGTRIVFD
jgi:hypothetical protein